MDRRAVRSGSASPIDELSMRRRKRGERTLVPDRTVRVRSFAIILMLSLNVSKSWIERANHKYWDIPTCHPNPATVATNVELCR